MNYNANVSDTPKCCWNRNTILRVKIHIMCKKEKAESNDFFNQLLYMNCCYMLVLSQVTCVIFYPWQRITPVINVLWYLHMIPLFTALFFHNSLLGLTVTFEIHTSHKSVYAIIWKLSAITWIAINMVQLQQHRSSIFKNYCEKSQLPDKLSHDQI